MKLLSNVSTDAEIEVKREDALELGDEGKLKEVKFEVLSSSSLWLCSPGPGSGRCRCPEHVARTVPEG